MCSACVCIRVLCFVLLAASVAELLSTYKNKHFFDFGEKIYATRIVLFSKNEYIKSDKYDQQQNKKKYKQLNQTNSYKLDHDAPLSVILTCPCNVSCIFYTILTAFFYIWKKD